MNQPERVAIVMGKFTTGGIKSVIMNYYKFVNKSQFQFDFIIDSDSPDNNYYDIESRGGKVYTVTPISKNPIKNVIEIKNILKKNNYKIVHGYLNTLNVFSMMGGYFGGTKVRIAENLSTAHPKEPKSKVKSLLKPFGKLFSTAIAANSTYAGTWLFGSKNIDNCKIIRNGLDLSLFKYSPELREIRRKELGLHNEFVVGHIGRYEFQKNHDFLIEIFNELYKKNKNSRLLLIGYGSQKERIWEKIHSLNLSNAVIDGGASTDNVANYNAMDVFLLPSYYEGLPVVGIEAQATGLPCVFSAEVTEETKVTDAAKFISLEKTSLYWAKIVSDFEGIKRYDTYNELTQAGYNIKEEVVALQRFYNELLDTTN